MPNEQAVDQRAAEVAKPCTLSDEARGLLCEELTPRDYFAVLRDRQLYADALRFLAHALPKRVAVWWGCLCTWAVNREAPQEKFETALQAAVRWVLAPTEDNRRAAEKPGQEVGLGDPAGALALAAFWSGGSMTPPDLPAVPPPAHLTGKVVGGAVLLAAVKYDASRQKHNLRMFAALGADVLQGRNLWTDKAWDDAPAGDPRQPPAGPKAASVPALKS